MLLRKRMRLSHYDYSRSAAYFVTICAATGCPTFGRIVDDVVHVSAFGDIVVKCWHDIPQHYAQVELDEFILMPDHLHGILIFGEAEAGHARPLQSVVGSFKAAASKAAGRPLWQRGFWDRIIRTDAELNLIRDYIECNPARHHASRPICVRR